MDSLSNILQKKADDLGDSPRDDISIAQEEIDRLFPNQVTITGIDKGNLFLKTKSSPMASELRLRQVEIIGIMNRSMKSDITTLRVFIR